MRIREDTLYILSEQVRQDEFYDVARQKSTCVIILMCSRVERYKYDRPHVAVQEEQRGLAARLHEVRLQIRQRTVQQQGTVASQCLGYTLYEIYLL